MVQQKRSLCVGLGEVVVTRESDVRLSVLGLGSCIAVCAYSASLGLGAMAHIVLPTTPEGLAPSSGPAMVAKYADKAVPHFAELLRREGAWLSNVSVVLCGGASIFRPTSGAGPLDIGGRNLEAVRHELERVNLRVDCEEVGGNESRTLHLDVDTGRVIVRSMRQGERVVAELGRASSAPVAAR